MKIAMIKVEFPLNFLCLIWKKDNFLAWDHRTNIFNNFVLSFLYNFFLFFCFYIFFKYTFVTLCKNSRAHPTVMAHRHKQTLDYLNRHNPQWLVHIYFTRCRFLSAKNHLRWIYNKKKKLNHNKSCFRCANQINSVVFSIRSSSHTQNLCDRF